MKRLVVLLGVLSAGFAGLADAFSDALDCSGLTFTTSSTTGTADWTVQANEVYRGATALRSGKISNDASTWLETTVEGPGELSFWWKASSESVNFDFLDISVDGDTQGQIGGMGLGWEEKRVLVKGKGPHTIRWTYQKDGSASSGEDCGWLDALSWTPAPEALVVSFNTDGGSAMPARIFEVGDVYGVLGVPVREGHTFLGWHEGDVLGAHVMEDRLVPFQAATTLYARWGRPVATAMRDAGLKFATSAANAFQLVNVRTPLGREAAGVEFAELDDEACQPWEACKSTLSTTVKGPCYVSFAWRGNFVRTDSRNYGSWVKWRLEVDGKEEASVYYEADDGKWKTEYLYLPKGAHRLRWTVKSRPDFREIYNEETDSYGYVVTEVPSFFVGDIVREPYGPQATPDAWASKLVNYGSWVTGDAAKF
ncbi:MAG: InlB B-repeat-containing protein, partial [bacterium]|nr:InlB B-repeat-containing protein [bacterium]